MKEGWKVVKLGEVASYINGYAFKPSDWHDKGVPIIRIQNLTETKSHYNYCKRKDIPYKYRVAKGDLLISWSATLGVFEWNETEAWLNQHIFKVVFDKIKINKYYFKYAVEASIGVMVKRTNGAIMKHIRKGDFDNIEIPLPPLPEQHRIVKKLDAAFEKIDAMKAKAEKNIENAKALFQQALAEELEPKEGWVEKKIKDIGEVVGGTTPNTSNKEFWNGDRCWISPAELHGEHYLYDSARKITELAVKSKNLKELPVGTVILSSRAPIGKVAINKVPMYCNQGFKCVVCGDSIYNEFLYWWFYGKTEYLNTLGTGATFLEISKTIVENIGISIPSLIEQQQIVTKLDILSAKCKKLEEAERKTIAECDALKQAILRQAFNGEL